MIVRDVGVISGPTSPTNQNFYNKQKSSKVSRTEDTLLFPPRVSEMGRGRGVAVCPWLKQLDNSGTLYGLWSQLLDNKMTCQNDHQLLPNCSAPGNSAGSSSTQHTQWKI